MAIDWEPWLKILQSETFWVGIGTAAIGSFAGAWGGAWAAQRIADRVKRRELLMGELIKCNTALELAHTICNEALTMKLQYIRERFTEFKRLEGIVLEAARRLRAGQHGMLDLGGVEMNIIEEFNAPIDRLVDKVFDMVTVSGRPRGAVSVLRRCIGSLNDSIRARNELMSEWHEQRLYTEQK